MAAARWSSMFRTRRRVEDGSDKAQSMACPAFPAGNGEVLLCQAQSRTCKLPNECGWCPFGVSFAYCRWFVESCIVFLQLLAKLRKRANKSR